jgi:hypothetical protein
VATAGLLAASGAPASAEAWVDRQAAGCHRLDGPRPRTSASAHPQAPANYRADTLHAAECQAWLRLHHRRPPLTRPSAPTH